MWRQLDLLRIHNSSDKEKNKDKIMVEETCKVKGNVKLYAFPADLVPDYETYLKLPDKEKYVVEQADNTITTLGFNVIPIILSGGTNTIDYAGVGTGSPSATALGTEVGTRVAISYHYAINNEYHLDTFYGKNDPNTSSNALTEAGLFSALTSGDMYCSKTISFTKTTSVTLLLAWYWSFA